MFKRKKLTLRNLVPSDNDQISLKSLKTNQRLALYNLCDILYLTSYKEEDRQSIDKLKELIRKVTLAEHNKCFFDKGASHEILSKTAEIMKKYASPSFTK